MQLIGHLLRTDDGELINYLEDCVNNRKKSVILPFLYEVYKNNRWEVPLNKIIPDNKWKWIDKITILLFSPLMK